MQFWVEKTASAGRLAEAIADAHLRDLFRSVMEELKGLHPAVRIETTSVDVRFYFGERLLCRIAPYRELLHFQIDRSPMWETRVSNERGCRAALDACIEEFLVRASRMERG